MKKIVLIIYLILSTSVSASPPPSLKYSQTTPEKEAYNSSKGFEVQRYEKLL